MATIKPGSVRSFERADVVALLGLMRDLAVFEGYASDFRVTSHDLIEHGLSPSPSFQAYVVDDLQTENLIGMAVTHIVPWTYTTQPNLVLKELYVVREARGLGVGRLLMDRVLQEALDIGAHKLLWTVLTNNEVAKTFYAGGGASPDKQWENWSCMVRTGSAIVK